MTDGTHSEAASAARAAGTAVDDPNLPTGSGPGGNAGRFGRRQFG